LTFEERFEVMVGMKNPFIPMTGGASRHWLAAALMTAAATAAVSAQGESLRDSLVAYWPMDIVQGTRTPDLKNGYDLNLVNMTAANLVPGRYGNAFKFNGVNTILTRIHASGEDLPAINHRSFTVSFWARVNGVGQNDKRMFSEGTAGSDPLFNLGTHSGGTNGAVDLFLRQSGTPLLDHLRTEVQPLNGLAWRHIIYWQEEKPDGASTRRIYIDGQPTLVIPNTAGAAPQEIPDKPANVQYAMNRTSIGAILRADASAFVNGEIDDVAIWKRALTPAEILHLHQNGMPEIQPPLEPLVINSFTADYETVAKGSKVRLHWDVTKDAIITLKPSSGPAIDVTPLSSFGVGAYEAVINDDEVFTLSIRRQGEPEIDNLVGILVQQDVAPGWHWVENFESRNTGNLTSQPRWLVAEGSVQVRDFAETLVAGVTAGNDLAGLNLRTFAVAPGTRRTLFFRFYQNSDDNVLPVNLLVGLTEKSLRNAGDFGAAEANNGTLVRFFRELGGALQLQARNGSGTGPYAIADYTFLPGYSYNVWIDVDNHPLNAGQPDRFSVHVAPENGTRTTVFDNFASDRLASEIPILGFPREAIDTLVIVGVGGDQASNAVLLDDFYISAADNWSTTVPVPGTLPGPPPSGTAPFRITGAVRNPDGSASITWNSEPGLRYFIQVSTDLLVWSRVDQTGVVASGNLTSFQVPGPFTGPRLFFRVER
jgi:hypothetical protein